MASDYRKDGLYAVELVNGSIRILESFDGKLFNPPYENAKEPVLPTVVKQVFIDSFIEVY